MVHRPLLRHPSLRRVAAALGLVIALVASLPASASASPALAVADPGADVSPAVGISAATGYTCAVRASGTVWCWGRNDHAQLGVAGGVSSAVPVQVAGLTTAVAVAAGEHMACALLADHTVWCWGPDVASPSDGIVETAVPLQVPGLTTATAITVTAWDACAIVSDGDLVSGGNVVCWGADLSHGENGVSVGTWSPDPLPVPGLANVTAIDGGRIHVCALVSGGTVECWGDSTSGRLGNGLPDPEGAPVYGPEPVVGIAGARRISAGADHSCALLADFTVMCWGLGGEGRLGDGTTYDRPVAVAVGRLDQAVGVSAGGRSTCAVRGDGTAWCWGFNDDGRLGDGSRYWSLLPVQVRRVSSAIAVAAGDAHACVLLGDGSIRCWGHAPNGESGDGVTGDHLQPVAVAQFPQATGAPSIALRSGAVLAGTDAPVRVSWTTGDGLGLGIESYEVARSVDLGATYAPVGTAASAAFSGYAPTTIGVKFQARMLDTGGYAGAWGQSPMRYVRLVQQSAATFKGTWVSASGASCSACSGGSAMASVTAGASASWVTSARSVAVVATKGPNMGRITVYVDGVSAGTVDLYRATALGKVVVFARNYGGTGTHTVRVVVQGTSGRPRVELDAFVLLK